MALFDFLTASPRPVLGLDISSTAVKLVELSSSTGGYKVKACHALPLPVNTIVEKEIISISALTQTLKKLLVESGTKLRDIAVAIPDVLVITKEIELPNGLTDLQLEEQIALEISEHIVCPVEDVAFDFEVLGSLEHNQDLINVSVTACRKRNIDSLKQAVENAELRLNVIDIQSCAIERAFKLIQSQSKLVQPQSVGAGNDSRANVVAIADIGMTTFNLCLLSDSVVIFSREQLFGGTQLAEEVQRRYGLSWVEFCQAESDNLLPHDYESAALIPFKRQLIEHIVRALQIFYSSSDHNHIDQLFLVGGFSVLQGLASDIQTALSVPTESANLLADMSISEELDYSAVINAGPSMLLAIGLALRSFD